MSSDPMEQMIEQALGAPRIRFVTGDGGHNPVGLDFYLPDFDVHIEVKQFHTARVAVQMARAENVIVAQGRAAVELLRDMIAAQAVNGECPKS